MSRRKRRMNQMKHTNISAVLTHAAPVQQMMLTVEAQPSSPAEEQHIEMIPLNQITTEGYQRVLNMANVRKIARHFDIAKVGVLVVNRRQDGTYAVLDGQHRLSAMRSIGKASANCIVLEGLTVKEEADYFRKQNENKQSLRVMDRFTASLWAEDEESLRITALMDKYGFRLGKSGYPMCICAVAALQRIVQLFGFSVLEKVLESIAVTWPNDTVVLRREMLAGLSEFWHRFAGTITVQQFSYRMTQKLPLDMYMEAKTRSSGKATPGTAFNKSIRFATCGVLMDQYNKGLRKDSKNRISMNWNYEGDE